MANTSNRTVTFEAKAVLKNLRSTPQKTRRVVNLIRNKSVAEARAILKFAPQGVSEPLLKLLNSGVSNILTKADRTGLRVSEDSLFVAEIFADEGPTMKRFRPRARGTAGRILKRTSHVTIFVATDEEVVVAPKRAKNNKKAEDAPKADDKATKTAAKADASDVKTETKNEGPAKKDPTKGAGKAHRKPTEPKKTATKAATKTKPVAERKENMRKKGA